MKTVLCVDAELYCLKSLMFTILLSLQSKCTVMELPSIPQKLQYYYDPLAIAIVVGFIIVQTLLCLLPVGRKVQTISGASVRCNGESPACSSGTA